jgi:uncharacterized SAM-binding protein YcdF (DUF218 family)
MLQSPGAWLTACCVLGAILLTLGFQRMGTAFAIAGALGFLAIAVLPIDQWCLAPLENRFAAAPETARFDGVIVLGGALETGLTQDRAIPSMNAAAERLVEFVMLSRKYPTTRLIFTGGPMPNRPDGPAEADGARQLFTSLGVAPDRVTYESKSRTTHENAAFTASLIQPQPAQTWLLVTSASHMPRAIGAFRAAGFHVIAYPVGYKTFKNPSLRASRGFGERLALLDIASHEWLGLLFYRLTGRSDALFPAP